MSENVANVVESVLPVTTETVEKLVNVLWDSVIEVLPKMEP